MGRHCSHLDLEERSRLADWLEAGVPVVEIALKLSRAPSTIYREINGYYGKIAQRNYEERRAVHRKMLMHPQVKAAVLDRLQAGWSRRENEARGTPRSRQSLRAQHEAIYRFAHSPDGRAEEWYRHLPEHRRRRPTAASSATGNAI